MKKIFTLLLCAALFVGSCWGATETTITIAGDGKNSGSTEKLPTFPSAKYSITQFVYLSSEVGNVTDKSISKVAFNAESSNSTYTRNLTIYIEHTKANTLSGWTNVTSSAVFTGNIEVPAAGGWYTITLSKSFTWNGTDNLLITIADNTGKADGQFGSYKKHCTYNSTINDRATGTSGNNAYNPASYSGGSTRPGVPQIKITFTSSQTTTPTITAPVSVNLDSLDAQYENDTTSFTVTASDLKDNITLTAGTGLSVSPSTITQADITTAGKDGVPVTVITTSAFNYDSPKIPLSSTGAETVQVAIIGKKASYYTPIATSYFNSAYSQGKRYVNYNAQTTITEVNTTNKQLKSFSSANFMVDYSAIPDTYAANGKISNLYGKFISSSVFKAFAFDYTAPVVTGITINEDADNTAILEQYDGEEVTTINIMRSFTKDMYNTICLPFEISRSALEGKFGIGCSIIELASSSYDGSSISLGFDEVSGNLEAGKPYLIKPLNNVTNLVLMR